MRLLVQLSANDTTNVLTVPLSPGDAGTDETIQVMRVLTIDASNDDVIRRTAEQIRGGTTGVTMFANRLFAWAKSNITFCADPPHIERLVHPSSLIRMHNKCFDCDELSMLLASFSIAVGYRPVFVTVGNRGEDFAHVFLGIRTEAGVLAIDPQETDAVGVYPNLERNRVWEILS